MDEIDVDIEKEINNGNSKKMKKSKINKSSDKSNDKSNDNFRNRKEFSEKIIKELIEPSYYDEIKSSVHGKKCWKNTGDIFETVAKILTGLAAIFAFAAGSFNLGYLSFISGCLNAIGLVMMGFAAYSTKESSERTAQVNKILRHLKMETIVDISDSNIENIT